MSYNPFAHYDEWLQREFQRREQEERDEQPGYDIDYDDDRRDYIRDMHDFDRTPHPEFHYG